MTLTMYDSVSVTNLPAGAEYIGAYVDGDFPTYRPAKARFPQATILSIAVFSNSDAECCDREQGDLTAAQVPGWVRRQLARGEPRPGVYASVANFPPILAALNAAGIKRAQVRLWAAHYGLGPHICGPATCKFFPGMPAFDGTQYTDLAPGAHGSRIDASLLHDDFFGGSVSATGPEHWDNADWQAFRNHQLWNLTRALAGNASGLDAGTAGAVDAAHKAFLALVPGTEDIAKAVAAAIPPGQAGGLTAAEVQQAVMAGLTTVLAKAVSGA